MPGTKENVYILGVGMTKFIKPRGLVDYPQMGFEAGVKAMTDAGINYDQVQQGVACYAYGDSTAGQRVFYQFGLTQIPIYNINNNCSTGSSGIFFARQLLQYGVSDCALVIGFEKMFPGSLGTFFNDRENPMAKSNTLMVETRGFEPKAPFSPQMFGHAGREYMEKFGAKAEDFGEIARVNHSHSVNNPYSQFQDVYTLDQIMKSPMIFAPLTKLQCCPTSDGASAVVLVNDTFLAANPHLAAGAVLIAGQSMCTDSPDVYSRSSISLVGSAMTSKAASNAYTEANINPRDAHVVELHDCFSTNEMVTIDALNLCDHGQAHEMVRKGDITYGGRCIVNPSGGLISKGHPLGATGLAQASELVWHMRGWATNRAYNGNGKDVKFAIQHNLGLGGAAVVSVYKRRDGKEALVSDGKGPSGWERLGYNPAVEARAPTEQEIAAVISKTKSSAYMKGYETKKKAATPARL